MNLNDSLSESRLISMINYIQPIPTIGVTNSHWPSSQPVWPDWAIFWTLGTFLKPLATINLPQSSPFLSIYCKVVKIIHFSSETILGNFYRHLAIFIWSHWSQPTCAIYSFLTTAVCNHAQVRYYPVASNLDDRLNFCLLTKYIIWGG